MNSATERITEEPQRSGLPARYIAAAAAAAATFLVYLTALGNEFVNWDDPQYILDNVHIRSLDPAFFRWAFFDFYAANWHPLTWISHALDYALWGPNPIGHHLTGIIVHACNTALVVLLAAGLIRSAAPQQAAKPRFILLAATVTGLLFGLHPLHVESVAWVSERKDLLCAFFFLLSLITYRGYCERKSGKPYLLTLLFFILALMSKPMAVSLPFVLLILDWYPFRRLNSASDFRSLLVEKLPFFALSFASSLITIAAQKSGGAMVLTEDVPLSLRTLVAAHALIAYPAKMILPLGLSPFYPYPAKAWVNITSLKYLIGPLLLPVITVAAAKRENRLWSAVWACYLVMLLPVIGLVQVGSQAMADRYTYLPSLGPFLPAGVGAALVVERYYGTGPKARRLIQLSAIILTALLTYGTVQAIAVWQNGIVLWSRVIEREQGSLPSAYANRGSGYARLRLYDKAVADFDRAISLKPSFALYHNRGMALLRLKKLDAAIADFSAAISLKPSDYHAYSLRGMAFLENGSSDRAIEDLDRAVSWAPSDHEVYENRGLALIALGRYQDALADYDRAIELNPHSHEALNHRGELYAQSGLIDRAVAQFSAAIAEKPDFALAYGNRGLAHTLEGDYDRALMDLTKAISLDSSYGEAYGRRGNVYLKKGNTAGAVRDFVRACELGDQEACRIMKEPPR